MQRRQTVCRILWKASDGRANQLIRLHRAGFVFLLLVRPREGVPWANEEHARCKPTASGDPSVDWRMALSRCCQSLGCHLSKLADITRNDLSSFSTPPAHAVCLAGRVEMGAKIGDDGPQTNPSRTCRRTNPTAGFAFQIRFQSISIFSRSSTDPTLAGGLILALTYR